MTDYSAGAETDYSAGVGAEGFDVGVDYNPAPAEAELEVSRGR